MESKTINTIEINGKAIDLSKKMVEVPRRKKFFETSKAYSEYLGSLLKEAFPYNEKLHSIEDYDFFIDYNVYKLWEAADETKETLKSKISRKVSAVKEKFSKNDEEETVKEIVEEKEEKKETLLTKLLKPIKSIGKVIFLPFTLVFRLVKTIGKKIRKGFKWINSKMPWSKKNKEEDDLEKMLEDAIENENNNDMADEMLNEAEEELEREAQEELSKGVKAELAKANEEEAKKLIESLNAKVEELNKENQTLKNRVEIYKKQPERNKIWEQYFKEEKEKAEEKESIENKIELVQKDIAKPTGFRYTKNKDGQLIWARPEIDNNVKITGALYERLLYAEYGYMVYMRDIAVNAYKVPFYQVDYNYNGLIEKNKEKIGGKIVNASVVLTKERYEELVENATKYFNLMGDVSYYSSNELENNNQKKLVK